MILHCVFWFFLSFEITEYYSFYQSAWSGKLRWPLRATAVQPGYQRPIVLPAELPTDTARMALPVTSICALTEGPEEIAAIIFTPLMVTLTLVPLFEINLANCS